MGINEKALMTQVKEKEKKFSFIKPGESKMLQQKQRKKSQGQGEKKGKGCLPHPHLFCPVHHPAHILNQKMKQQIKSSKQFLREKNSNGISHRAWQIMQTFILKIMFLIDINKKMLMENPVPSNLQVVPVLDDFVKALLVSQMVITTDQQMEKFQEKLLQVRGLLSRLQRKLEDVGNESSEAVEVPPDTFATLTEQTTLLLGQASLSILYTHCLNILKTLWKDPCKAKALLKEKQPHCQKMNVTYLAKNPFTHN